MMRTLLVLVLTSILTLFSTYTYAGTVIISDVSIEGLKNVKLISVLSVVNLKKGKCYSNVAARKDVRSILEMGCFDNVEIRFDNISGNLTFVVTEKPYVERIAFNGNLEFSEGKLKRESVLKEKNYYDFSKLEETKKKISSLYGDEGYADCKIEVYPSTDFDTNRMTITFLITENNRIVVEEVKVKGMFFFKEKEILKLMNTNPGKMFREDIYQTDLKSIEVFYKSNGFIDYKFVSPTVVYNDVRTKMFLTLNISEGSRYKISSITYDGNSIVDSKEIEKTIKFKKGQIFNQDKIIEAMNLIYKLYYERRYTCAKIVPHFNKDIDGGIVDVNLSIEENSALYVGNIYIGGLLSTRDQVIRRELLIKPGEVLTNGNLHRSIEKIYSLGFVSNVEHQLFATDNPDVVDLKILITEKDFSGKIGGGIGYSSDNQLVASAQIQHPNIFGLGQKLSLLGEFCKKKQDYEIEWIEPYIFDKNMSLILNAFNVKKNMNYSSSKDHTYKENRIGFLIKAGHKINNYMSLLFGYSYEHVKLLDISPSLELKIKKELDFAKERDKPSSIFTQFIYDLRDYVFNPSRGSIHIADLYLASDLLGGNVNFVKGIVKSKWFFPTFWKFILSVSLQNGVIIPYKKNQSKIPIYDRFYLGGSDTIRGYALRTEIGSLKGSTIMGFMNIEYKFPIVFYKGRELIQGIIFYDIGGSWRNYCNINLVWGSKKENVHSGIGFGIKIMFPLIPLKIEWGYGLNHEKAKRQSQVYFSFGGN
ncbi:outer membrane protein assembly factor BamA [Endomicrobiia bacterium]|nr:outer membrane protein assembly factor BamA [Endomicrobiia bacterium]GHT18731.1 outer membrane protein assembly factor BamA [Endomicrobiia bacterium]GHT29890.1 outer membrane protein assembly factor BamA [Endomicrobiia bacterium]